MSGRDNRSKSLARSSLTGAVVSGSTLSIVTLRALDGSLVLHQPRTAWFEAQDTGQDGLRRIKLEIEEFFWRSGIQDLVLRAASNSNKFAAAPIAYKIEAILQLLPISVAMLPAASVTAWLKRTVDDLPQLEPGLASARREIQRRAIETTCCAFDRISAHGASHGR